MQQGSGRKKGIRSEITVKQAARELVGKLPIVSICNASRELDKVGVDLIFGLNVSGDLVQVPIQVKSSTTKARQYRRKYKTYVPVYKVIIVVVNKLKTLEDICDELYRKLKQVIDSGIRYTAFFEMLAVKRSKADQRPRIETRELLNEMPLIGSRKKMRFSRVSHACMQW